MYKFFSSLIGAMLVFAIVEVLFVLFIFHDVHIGNFATITGILHVSYWVLVIVCAYMRNMIRSVWGKAICTAFPIVYHGVLHGAMAGYLVYEHHDHDDHGLWMIVLLSFVALVLVCVGEYVIHRRWHCLTHHDHAHAYCHDKDCVSPHKK